MASRLQEIVDAHRAVAAADERRLDDLLEQARSAPSPLGFAGALKAPGLSVIAEVKRRSPSAGSIKEDLDPVTLAKEYEAGGAACISVLTDEKFFGGSADDLRAVREAVSIPVLRKDFTVDARDIVDARIMGADAVLLIAAVLSDAELADFQLLTHQLGMAALVEVHDEDELARVQNAPLIGVNQRDLRSFDIDATTASRLRNAIPASAISVAESAIKTVSEAQAMFAAGYDAVLVGTALVTSDDPRQMLQDMTGAL